MKLSTSAQLLVLAASSASAFWRMPCRARTGLARIDPLVSNGTLSEHAHALHGSNGFSIDAGYDQLMAGDCTSCQVSQDKSAYWTPAFYFKDASTGQFELVEQVGGMLAYYLLYPNSNNDSLTGFPKGFAMIAGDTNLRNFSDYAVPDIPKSNWQGEYATQDFLRQAAVGFNCLNYQKTPEGTLYRHFLPDKAYLDANCADGIRAELMFPSCWNRAAGVAPDGHKSHVAYPSQVMTGDCPEGFPERLPSMLYETIWNTAAFVGREGEFIISNGDPTGYGYHGDFMMGWDEHFLQSAVDTCTNLSGQIEDCPLFTIQDSDVYSNCDITLPAPLVAEKVLNDMSTLPGNPPIAYGPGYAIDPAPASVSISNPAPTLPYSAGSSIASTASYQPGGIFAVSVPPVVAISAPVAASSTSTSSTSTSTSAAAPAVTSAPSISYPAAPSQSYFSTAWTTSGQVVEEVLWVEEVVYVTDQSTSTVVVPGRKRHLHEHAARHNH